MARHKNINYELAWYELKEKFIHQIELSEEDSGKVYIADLQGLMDELEFDFEY